jgi:hypothetical protein
MKTALTKLVCVAFGLGLCAPSVVAAQPQPPVQAQSSAAYSVPVGVSDRVTRSLGLVQDVLGRERLGELIESDVILSGADVGSAISGLERILSSGSVSALKRLAVQDVIDRLRRLDLVLDQPTGALPGDGASPFLGLPPSGLGAGGVDYRP